MEIWQTIKYRIIESWGFTLAFILSGYFILHGLGGAQNIHQFQKLEIERSQLQALAEITRLEKDTLERRITAMQSHGLDPDLLEEHVRRKLGFAHPDEVVLFLK